MENNVQKSARHFEVILTDIFSNNMEDLICKKKFTSLSNQIKYLKANLENGRFFGDCIPNLKLKDKKDNNRRVYKLRLPNKDTKSGKSNGLELYIL